MYVCIITMYVFMFKAELLQVIVIWAFFHHIFNGISIYSVGINICIYIVNVCIYIIVFSIGALLYIGD